MGLPLAGIVVVELGHSVAARKWALGLLQDVPGSSQPLTHTKEVLG